MRRASRRPSSAHPRSRGENQRARSFSTTHFGSSPLTRGKLVLNPAYSDAKRLIPAHAGKTVSAPNLPPKGTAHPRSRGENADAALPRPLRNGSSPLTRGKRSRGEKAGGGGGLIPAHAGKTPKCGQASDRLTAHPRSRGENSCDYQLISSQNGSSPLTRGKLYRFDPSACGHRLIPAHAGKTDEGVHLVAARGAHPRSRGENTDVTALPMPIAGSSPLTRGKRRRLGTRRRYQRLIPAHAGKTSHLVPLVPFLQAHPRSRGENTVIEYRRGRPGGSSPLTRGKQGG